MRVRERDVGEAEGHSDRWIRDTATNSEMANKIKKDRVDLIETIARSIDRIIQFRLMYELEI